MSNFNIHTEKIYDICINQLLTAISSCKKLIRLAYSMYAMNNSSYHVALVNVVKF